jgi:hypothetical protein
MFNISNHPSTKWSSQQLEAAKALGGEVIDIAFPAVPSSASTAEVDDMAEQLAADVFEKAGGSPTQAPAERCFAMVQGEMCLTFTLVRALQNLGVTCVAACSDRRTVEQVQPDGTTVKTAVFEFVQFRPYSNVK